MQTSNILSIVKTSATDAQAYVSDTAIPAIQNWWADSGKEQTKAIALWLSKAIALWLWAVAQLLAFIIVFSTVTIGICLFRIAQAIWQNRSAIKKEVCAYTFNIWAAIQHHVTLFFDRYIWPIGDFTEVLIWGV